MKHIFVSEELLRQVVDDLMSINPGNMTPMAEETWLKSTRSLIAALERPAVEPVAWMWKDGTTTSDPDRADGTWLPLYAAPQAQRPPRVGSGVTVEQTLAQWEHDLHNPMTPEQQAEWVKREREFAVSQAKQQPQLLTDEEIEKLQYEHVGVTKWFPNLARAIERAVLKKNGAT